jgi:Flp pilus assembly protein TadD
MAQHALDALETTHEPGTLRGRWCLLRGYALRALGRCAEAIEPLHGAAEYAPNDIHIWLALGWCYKRIRRIDLAIESLEHAQEAAPNEALILYNLACYWSLAGNKRHALEHLARALELAPDYREMIPAESDFDAFRNDPDFQALVGLSV